MTRANCTEIKKKNRLKPLTGNYVRKAAACFGFSRTQKRRKETALRLVLFRRVIMTIECSQSVHSIVRFCLSFSLRDILFLY